ncbi:MAG: hypothetical protein JNL67_13655 [Planctomycetaceae bacterium]|nr:hypothetical protein [Planctomycetaceae bacterium]
MKFLCFSVWCLLLLAYGPSPNLFGFGRASSMPMVQEEKSSEAASENTAVSNSSEIQGPAVGERSQDDVSPESDSNTDRDEVNEPKFELPGWAIEQSIYIPYERIRDKFEATGRGVYLPYEQFEELWKAAQKATKPVESVPAPASFALVSAQNRASLERSLVRVDSELLIDFVQSGWHRVPLGLNGCSVQLAEIDGEPCRLVPRDDGGFDLLFQAKSDHQQSKMQLQYVTGVVPGGGENRISWPIPPAAINRWEISINQADVDIVVTPAVVTSDTQEITGGDDGGPAENKANRSSVIALLGNSKTIEVRWTPRSVGAEGLAALITAQSNVESDIQRNLVRSSHVLTLQIQRAEINYLELAVPPDLRIVNVLSDVVKKWQVDTEKSLLKIDLFENLKGTLSLTVETEMELGGDPNLKRKLTLTPIQAPAATRQPGTLLVRGENGLRIEVATLTGLSRVNEGQSQNVDAGPTRLSFQYSTVPYELNLDLEEWTPLVEAQQQVHAQLESRRITTSSLLLLNVKQRGIFQVPLDVPEGLEIVSVTGHSPSGYQPVQIEKYERVGEPAGRVLLQFAVEARGPVACLINTTQAIPGVGLVDFEAAPSTIAVRWPQLAPSFAQSIRGQVLLTAPDRLNVVVDTTNQVNFRSIEPSTAFVVPDSNPQRFAYEYVVETNGLELRASLRRPRVFVDQVTSVSVESGLLRYQTDLDYDVRFSAVPDFRIDVLQSSQDRIRVVGGTLNQQKLDPQPPDVAAGFVAWRLVGASELLGKHSVQLAWDVSVPEIAVGATKSFEIATVVAKNVERDRGQIVLRRSELFDVQATSKATGLRPIDPTSDVFGGRQYGDAVAALEYVGPWDLDVDVSRYELYDLKRSSISRSLIQAVWLRNDSLSVRALYRLKSVNQRLVIIMPPGFDPQTGFDSSPVRVDGEPISLERGAGGELILPLGNRDRDRELLLELRYTMPVTNSEIPVPTFPDDCAVQKAELVVYLPKDWAPLNFGGPWSDQDGSQGQSILELLQNVEPRSVNLNWIATAEVPTARLMEFETDGRPFTFSTINPLPGSAGALKVTKVSSWLLSGAGAALVVFLGLLFIRRTWNQRLALIAVGLGILIVASILWPFAVRYINHEGTTWAALVIGIVWIGRDLLTFLGQRRQAFEDPANDVETRLESNTPSSNGERHE